jgi:ribosomal protein S18 acetylase RimI-like enzyme
MDKAKASPPPIAFFRASEWPSVSQSSKDLDAIFFSSSATQTFASDADRATFRERWLGRYLQLWPEHFWVAVSDPERVVGYLAGCVLDPARLTVFHDHAFLQAFAHLTPHYPAHLHINVDESHRSSGIGARLIEAFCVRACDAGAIGVHVVTMAGTRNVRFYNRLGFAQVGAAEWQGRQLVMLGRQLTT